MENSIKKVMEFYLALYSGKRLEACAKIDEIQEALKQELTPTPMEEIKNALA